MKVPNKFKIGDTIYYPAADMRIARIIKGEVTGILVTGTDKKPEIAYQTGQTFAISSDEVFKTGKPAARRLIQMLKEKRVEIASEIDGVIKQINETPTKDLISDLQRQDDSAPEPTEKQTV